MIPPQLITAGMQLVSPLVNKLLGINNNQQNTQTQQIDMNTQQNMMNTQQIPGQELQAGTPLPSYNQQQMAPPMMQQMPLQTTQTNILQPNQNAQQNNGMNMMGGLLPLLMKNKQQQGVM